MNIFGCNNEKHFEPIADTLSQAVDYVKAQLDEIGIPADKKTGISRAVYELYQNIEYYSGATFAKVRCYKDGGAVKVVLIDNGKAFDPIATHIFQQDESGEECADDAVGIFLALSLVPDITYEYVEACNVLTLTANV